MTVTATTFKQDFPEFSSVADAEITRLLTRTALRIDAVKYGSFFDEAHNFLTAHYLAMRSRAGMSAGNASGAIRRIDVDGFNEVEFQSTTQPLKGLESTVYGQQFLEIQRTVILPTGIY